MGFMVFKLTGSDSRFQRKNRNNFFFTYKGVCAIFRAISDTVPGLGFEFRFLRLFTQTQSHTFGT